MFESFTRRVLLHLTKSWFYYQMLTTRVPNQKIVTQTEGAMERLNRYVHPVTAIFNGIIEAEAWLRSQAGRPGWIGIYMKAMHWSLASYCVLMVLRITVAAVTCDPYDYHRGSCGRIDAALGQLINIPATFLVAHVQLPHDFVFRFLPWVFSPLF